MLALHAERQRGAQRPDGLPPPEEPGSVQPSRGDKSLLGIVTAASLGLGDKKDATVRRLCLETLRQVLQSGDLRLLAGKVNEQMPVVIDLLAADDLAVCLAAHQLVEELAAARRKLRGIAPDSRAEIAPPGAKKQPAEVKTPLDGVSNALPALKRSLAHKEVRVRLAALYVLETLGDEAAAAVEEVAQSLKDENGFVRWGAVRVLNNLAPRQAEKAVPALAEALKDNNKTVRLAAAQALQRYGPQAKTAVNPLTQAVQDGEAQVRMAAINALAAIGSEAHPALAAVGKALADPEQKPEVRAAAAKALGRLGSLNAETRKALTAALADSDAAVRQAASETLLENES